MHSLKDLGVAQFIAFGIVRLGVRAHDSENRTDSGFTQSSTSAERRVSISPSRSGKAEISRGKPTVLDLEEVDLVDIEGIRFLNAREDANA